MKIEEWPWLMGRIDNPGMGARLDKGRNAGICIFGCKTVKRSRMLVAAAFATKLGMMADVLIMTQGRYGQLQKAILFETVFFVLDVVL